VLYSFEIELDKEKIILPDVSSYKLLLSNLKPYITSIQGKLLLWFKNSKSQQTLLTEKNFQDLPISNSCIRLTAAAGFFPTPYQMIYLTNYFDKYKSTIKGKIREVFRKLIKLRYLDLNKLEVNESLISAQDMTHLANALPVMQFLEDLELRGGKIELDAAINFFPKIQTLSHLKSLEISEIKLEVDAVKVLGQGIQELKELKEFGLIQTKIEATGMKCLAAPLSQLENLQKLNLRANELGGEGAKYLAMALVCLKNIKILNVSQNNIGAEGIGYLAKVLVKLNLAEFYAKSNKLGIEGGKIMRNILFNNKSLEELDVSFNKLEDNGARELLSGAYFSNVKKITISHNETSQVTERLINIGIVRNK